MLIINILLILLFFIILLYEVNIIEGQEENNTENDTEPNNFYNYNNLLSDYDNILSKIDLSNYIGFDIKDYMKKYNNQCKDDNEELIPNELYDELKTISNVNMEMDVINVENEFNNILSNFNIQIENDHGLSDKKELDNSNNNNLKKPKICSLVNTLYDENNNLPDKLTKYITDKYGNCFTTEGEDTFRTECKKSCHLQEEKLEICQEKSIDDLKNCKDYLDYEYHYRTPIHIKKDNGLYYNCFLNISQPEAYYEEKPCIPKNNICKSNKVDPTGGSCEIFNASTMSGKCEDYYMFDGEYYNCQSDPSIHEDGLHACVKNIKEHYNKPCINKNIDIINYDSCNYEYNK